MCSSRIQKSETDSAKMILTACLTAETQLMNVEGKGKEKGAGGQGFHGCTA